MKWQSLIFRVQCTSWHVLSAASLKKLGSLLQVSDSYVGLDQTFWLDTYNTKDAAQPMAMDSTKDAQDTRRGSRAAHRRGNNAPKGKAEGISKKEVPIAKHDHETSVTPKGA